MNLARAASPINMKKKQYLFTQNRELSWLKFNQRVLEEAADAKVPLLERLKFAAIFTSNLDEFFRVRCGSLADMALVDPNQIDSKSGMTPSEQLAAIHKEVKHLYTMRDNILKNLNKTLGELQILPMAYKDLNKKQQKYLQKYFDDQLRPLLAPQIIDLHHPFPFLINEEIYIFFQLSENGKTRYGLVPVPDFIHRVIYLNDEKTEYILAENVILHKLNQLFPKDKILFKTIIRVTRNADINLNSEDIEEDEDYRQFMKKILKRRNRLAPVRLELYKNYNEEAVNYLCKQLHLNKDQVFISKNCPLDFSHIFSLVDHLPADIRKPLLYEPYVPKTTNQLDPCKPLIPQVLDHDVLLSYPYQDIDLFIDLLKEASVDPDVISIKITIYRLAKNSKIVHYLRRAAENGKEVTVLMELRARFDEDHNIYSAERLEEAGCNVIYGFEDYKVHSKILQITLQKGDRIETITQIGTGNYNEKTSRQYTDFSFITSREDIGKDAQAFFQNMNISNLNGTYERLLVSPHALKQHVLEKLDQQIALANEGRPAYADFKMNSLTDLDIIKKLAEASNAGVKVRMIVRGICDLLPGLEGYTDNIEIHSIVGRYLEHGRIYLFGHGPDAEVYISSADFMTRNTERRVEVAVPIEEPQLKKELQDYFEIQFADNAKGRKLLSSGYYTNVDSDRDEPLDSQQYFMDLAEKTVFVPKPEEEPKPDIQKGWFSNLFTLVRKPFKKNGSQDGVTSGQSQH